MVSWAITGAARGLGLAWVRHLSKDENNVVFAIVRNPEAATDVQKLAGKNVHVVKGDLDSFTSLQAAAEEVASTTGGSLDILINNAAYIDTVHYQTPITQLTTIENLETAKDAFSKSFTSNIMGPLYVTNAFLPLIEKGKEKKIIHISTGMAEITMNLTLESPVAVPYSVSKAGTNMIVAKYASALRPKGIKVIGLSPGWVATREKPDSVINALKESFRKINPSVTGQISPEDSVRMQKEVIDKLGWEVNGRMISQNGDENWI